MLALDPDAGEATHKTLQLFGRKHGGDPVWSLCNPSSKVADFGWERR
jgi:hypothetical protein